MPSKFILNPYTKITAGSLRDRVTLFTRTMTRPLDNSVDFTEQMQIIETVWAFVKPIEGFVQFGTLIQPAVSIKKEVTHEIYIRFRTDITQENWLQYKTNYFDIVTVANPDESNRYLMLSCRILGDTGSEGASV